MPKTLKDIVRIDHEDLEKTVFILKRDDSPIFEYLNGVKTEKVKGYKVGALGIDGPYQGIDLTLRSKDLIPKIKDSLMLVKFKVDMNETTVYTTKDKPGIQFSLWVSEIYEANVKGA